MVKIQEPKVFFDLGDETKTGDGQPVRPIYFSPDGTDATRHVCGLVHHLTDEGREALEDAFDDYNDANQSKAAAIPPDIGSDVKDRGAV